jgi:hypothetical protein
MDEMARSLCHQQSICVVLPFLEAIGIRESGAQDRVPANRLF